MKLKKTKGMLHVFLWCLCTMLTFSIHTQAQSMEYMVKASMLGKIAKYTTWPDSILSLQPEAPFVICIVGKNPFGNILDRVYSIKKIKSRAVKVIYIEKEKPLEMCHILFLASGARHRLKEVIQFSKQHNVLTFADSTGMAKKGICVNFSITGKETIHFSINTKSLKENDLQVNPLLLDYGRPIKR